MPETQHLPTPIHEILPARYREILPTHLTPLQVEQLLPLAQDISRIHTFIDQHIESAHIDPIEMRSYRNISAGEALTPTGNERLQLAAQIYHIEQVNNATLGLKARLVKQGLPERIIAVQLGTGFEPPDTTRGFEEVDFISYGDKLLQMFPDPKVEGHAGGGIHVYRVTDPDGNELTALVIKGRLHGYAEIDSLMPHLTLAQMPRILKGIGVESILATFASGFDVVVPESDERGRVGDLGVMFAQADLSGLSAIHDPGSGDQTFVGAIYGGPFKPTVMRRSDETLSRVIITAFEATQRSHLQHHDAAPALHPVYAFDAMSTPDFEAAPHIALAKLIGREIDTMGRRPEPIARLFPTRKTVTIAHCMSTCPETSAYSQRSHYGGVDTIFNRSLPFVAMVGCTDVVDSHETSGGSVGITHQEVQDAARAHATFNKQLIHTYVTALASLEPIA